jgi:hypothetical protein
LGEDAPPFPTTHHAVGILHHPTTLSIGQSDPPHHCDRTSARRATNGGLRRRGDDEKDEIG